MSAETELKPRSKPSDEGRWIWLASSAVERIINRFGATQAAYGIAVYVALCRESSRKSNASVTLSIATIAGAARLSYKKTLGVLHLLASDEIKVISIQENRQPGRKTQQDSTYTLLTTRRSNRKSAQTSIQTVRPDCIGSQTSYTENPKDSPPKGGERVNNNANSKSPDSVSGSVSVINKEAWRNGCPDFVS